MGLSTDVTLPRDAEPVFPFRCVCCGEPDPDGSITVTTQPIGAFKLVAALAAPLVAMLDRNRTRVDAPACEACARAFARAGRRRTLIEVAYFAVAIVAAVALLYGRTDLPERVQVVILTLVVLVPAAVVAVAYPPAFAITVFKRKIDYEFRDREYAEEFAELNGAEAD